MNHRYVFAAIAIITAAFAPSSLAQAPLPAALTSGGTVQSSGLTLVLGQPFAAATPLGTFGVVPLLSGGTAPACPADFNGVGGVTVQDIFDYLAAYFAGCTAPGVPSPTCPRSADFNGSGGGAGGITVQDIFDFLAAYFQGC